MRDLYEPTYGNASDLRIQPILSCVGVPQFSNSMRRLPLALDLLLEHRFDLLGSRWHLVSHGAECRGLEDHKYESSTVLADAEGRWLAAIVNASNVESAQRLWKLIEEPYTPIDWQRDFVSGWRWSERTWYRDIEFGKTPGADIKVPWELGRMQHLPLFAWGYQLSHGKRSKYVREFRNQVLDFIATNPTRFGVNWACAMDVGIRVANWLVAYDIFRSFGVSFDEAFEDAFAASVYDHAEHIASNLETEPFRGNHYLANIVGLLFASTHLPSSPKVDEWLAFSANEFLGEIENQFNPDGTNFEGSTAYHCFTAEMVLYATALLLGLPLERKQLLQEKVAAMNGGNSDPFISQGIAVRIRRMTDFVSAIRDANGEIPQIGDNDSGRFLKLEPDYRLAACETSEATHVSIAVCEEQVWVENGLNRAGIVDAGRALIGRTFSPTSLEGYTIRLLSRGNMLPCTVLDVPGTATSVTEWAELKRRWGTVPPAQHRTCTFEFDPGILVGLEQFAFNDFGIYVIRTPRMRLVFRCGPIGQHGIGGHSHDDQLSVDLCVDGQHVLVDPGTYVYTPLPSRRNEYRASFAHNGPRPIGKRADLESGGLFAMKGVVEGERLFYASRQLAGRLCWPDVSAWRAIEVTGEAIVINDWIEGNFSGWEKFVKLPYSRGYGWQETKRVQAE